MLKNVEGYLESAPDSKLVQKTCGQVLVSEYSEKERVHRAFRALALVWAGTFLCIFIPLLHFILVPAGLIAGPILAWWTHGITSEINNGTVDCPNCGQLVPIEKQQPKWPLREICQRCKTEFRITLLE